jgi:hypothetical protein
MNATLTRAAARKLLDLIPDEPEYQELITALDMAQGDADDEGTDEVFEVKIIGARL